MIKQAFYYVLGPGNIPIPATDIAAWGELMLGKEKHRRKVAVDKVGELEVSTAFIGMDHNFADDGPPLVFETMVFDGEGGGGEWRWYATWDDAERGHREMIERLRRDSRLKSA